jgi:hypothetical protein
VFHVPSNVSPVQPEIHPVIGRGFDPAQFHLRHPEPGASSIVALFIHCKA